jgi:hypothetical protein
MDPEVRRPYLWRYLAVGIVILSSAIYTCFGNSDYSRARPAQNPPAIFEEIPSDSPISATDGNYPVREIARPVIGRNNLEARTD